MSEKPNSLEAEIERAQTLLRQPGLPSPMAFEQHQTEPRPLKLIPLIEEATLTLDTLPISDISLGNLEQFTYESTLEDPNPIKIRLKDAIIRELNPKIRFPRSSGDVVPRAFLATVIEIAQDGLKTKGTFPNLVAQAGFWVLESLLWRQQEVYARYNPEYNLEEIVDPARDRYIQGLSVLLPLLNDDLSKQVVVITDILRAPFEVRNPALHIESLEANIKLNRTRSRLLKLAIENYQLLRLPSAEPTIDTVEEPPLPLDILDIPVEKPVLPVVKQDKLFQ